MYHYFLYRAIIPRGDERIGDKHPKGRFAHTDQRFGHTDRRFGHMDGRFASLEK